MSFSLLRRAWTGSLTRSIASCRSLRTPSKTCYRSASTATATVSTLEGTQDDSTTTSPTFRTIKDALSTGTYKAVTVQPYKFQNMTQVQEAVLGLLPDLALPHADAKNPRDVMVRARTGTGKTLAFLVPAIEARLNILKEAGKKFMQENGSASDDGMVQQGQRAFARENVGTLILTPTRELALQIAKEAANLTAHHPHFQTHVWIGAMSKGIQMRDFQRLRRDIIVATPGRLRDLIENEPDVKNALMSTRQVIFDEADTMLEIGFRDDIEAIMEHLPPTPERQTFLFSATLSSKVRDIARKHLAKDHTYIDCIKEEDSPVHADIPQYHTVVPSASEQIPHLLRLIAHDQLTHPGSSKVIVFLPTTKMTQLFATVLTQFGRSILPAGNKTQVLEIHSKRPQHTRSKVSEWFRNDKSGASVLVTSDVSARGVDYPGVTRVIQIGIPSSREQYIHRVGRTGRGSKAIQGRGDFVLLPWEVGFVSWQLTDIPIRPITVTELKSQLSSLAEKHDESPDSYVPRSTSPPTRPYGRTQKFAITKFQAPYTPLLEEFERLPTEVGGQLDSEAIRETFLSLVGYYCSKSTELRVSTNVILDGCKSWTKEALAQDEAPHVSPLLLAKLGIADHQKKSFGNRGRYIGPNRGHATPFRPGREKVNRRSEWAYNGRDSREPDEESEQYRPSRYGKGSSFQSGRPSRRTSSFGDRPQFDRPRRERTWGNQRSSQEWSS
ncbi:hypothetical protein PM082_001266 [Marasmius tenuissimus]|nr:hypothetical protein PM082_001266 [Marasmius tenuissimus]